MGGGMGGVRRNLAGGVNGQGGKRVNPACNAAAIGSKPASICSVANLTTRMLLEVATPMHMIVPVSAGTLSVVCVTKRNHAIPASAPGSAQMMMKGSNHD